MCLFSSAHSPRNVMNLIVTGHFQYNVAATLCFRKFSKYIYENWNVMQSFHNLNRIFDQIIAIKNYLICSCIQFMACTIGCTCVFCVLFHVNRKTFPSTFDIFRVHYTHKRTRCCWNKGLNIMIGVVFNVVTICETVVFDSGDSVF